MYGYFKFIWWLFCLNYLKPLKTYFSFVEKIFGLCTSISFGKICLPAFPHKCPQGSTFAKMAIVYRSPIHRQTFLSQSIRFIGYLGVWPVTLFKRNLCATLMIKYNGKPPSSQTLFPYESSRRSVPVQIGWIVCTKIRNEALWSHNHIW